MPKQYQNIGKIGTSHILNITAKGDGLAVTIPAEIVSTYNLIAGDRLKVSLLEHFRKVQEQ